MNLRNGMTELAQNTRDWQMGTRSTSRSDDRKIRKSDAATTRPPLLRRAQWLERAASDSGPQYSFGWADLNGSFPRSVRGAFPDLDRALRSGALIGGAMQSLSRQSIELGGRALHQHINAGLKVVNSRTPEEFLLAQHEFLRTSVAEFTHSMRRMTEVISKMVE
jgi:Phasin protein